MSPSSNNKTSSSKPRRPLTAYNFFFHDERQKLQDQLYRKTGQRPTYTQISRLVGASWKKIDGTTKAHYEALAIKDKRRYALELVGHKTRQEAFPQDEGGVPAACVKGVVGDSGQALPRFPALATTPTHLNQPANSSNNSKVKSQLLGQLNSQTMKNNSPFTVNPVPCQAMFSPRSPTTTSSGTIQNLPLLTLNSPEIQNQMALLSVMMIDYVRKVAPERLAGAPSSPSTEQQMPPQDQQHEPTVTAQQPSSKMAPFMIPHEPVDDLSKNPHEGDGGMPFLDTTGDLLQRVFSTNAFGGGVDGGDLLLDDFDAGIPQQQPQSTIGNNNASSFGFFDEFEPTSI